MEVRTFVLTLFAISSATHGNERQSGLVGTDDLDKMLRTAFSQQRNHEQPDGKSFARDFIRGFAEGNATDLVEQTYQKLIAGDVESEETGINFIFILRGDNWGTSDDRPLVVGAHYDTFESTPGVDDNGSGMTALLSALSYIKNQLVKTKAKLQYSLIFVALDFEEKGEVGDEFGICLGSRLFVEEYLVPNVLDQYGIPHESFQGAIILETVMNWNNSEDSQMLPGSVQQVDPENYKTWEKGGSRGNFLALVSREDDFAFAANFDTHWEESFGVDKYQTWLIKLPFSGRPSDLPLESFSAFDDFFRSDHYRFWNQGNASGLKAVMLTDTAEFRGTMQACYHHPCDSADSITDDKLQFLAKVTDTVVRMALDAAEPVPSGAFSNTCWQLILCFGLMAASRVCIIS